VKVIGIVVVSHSPLLARAAVELASRMVIGKSPKLAIAAGVYDGSFGTDATAIAAAITEVASPDGVLVLVDIGGAVHNSELALELIDLPDIEVHVTSAPFVEGLIAGLVRAAAGGSLEAAERDARESLSGKRGKLGDPAERAHDFRETGDLTIDLRLRNPSGLHIRPASMVVLALAPLDAVVTVANLRTGSGPRLANSATKLLALAAQKGDVVRVSASGRQAQAALDLVRTMVVDGFGLMDAPAASPLKSAT
jgi:phosphotransferase system HPr (HPr) family protein